MISARPGCVRECRGCPERDRPYEEGLRAKDSRLRDSLASEGIPLDRVEPIVGADEADREGYRSRILLHARPGATGWEVGLLVPARSAREEDRVLPIPECPIHAPEANRLLGEVARTFPAAEPLRYVGWSLGTIIVVLKKPVPTGTDPGLEEWARGFREANPSARGMVVNYHPSAGDRVYAKGGWRTLFGQDRGTYRCLDRDYRLPPDAFSQAIHAQYERALLRAREHLFPASDAVLDLYSGIGISLDLWKSSGAVEVAGFELSSSATASMRERGHQAWTGPCADRVPQIESLLTEWRSRGLRIAAFVNPSRLGLEPEVSKLLLRRRGDIARLAYLSCSPRTLARDLSALRAGGWGLRAVRPYDFMPWAGQVEALALLD
jgi:23S rRNA (uracil1939-C5)-methyltransferase